MRPTAYRSAKATAHPPQKVCLVEISGRIRAGNRFYRKYPCSIGLVSSPYKIEEFYRAIDFLVWSLQLEQQLVRGLILGALRNTVI